MMRGRKTGGVAPNLSRLLLVLLLSGSVAGGAASAQETSTGTLVPGRDPSTMVSGLSPVLDRPKTAKITKARLNEINAARETMRVYSACLLSTLTTKAEHAALVTFLKMPPQTIESARLAKRLARPNCLPLSGGDYVMVTLTSDVVRGGLMRALYMDTKRVPPRHRVLPQEIDGASPTGNATFDLLRRFGTCVVAKQGAAANRFVTSTIGSAEEIGVVQALSPSLNGCLEKGRSVHFSYGILEGVLAEALFNQQDVAPVATDPKGAN